MRAGMWRAKDRTDGTKEEDRRRNPRQYRSGLGAVDVRSEGVAQEREGYGPAAQRRLDHQELPRLREGTTRPREKGGPRGHVQAGGPQGQELRRTVGGQLVGRPLI